MDYFKDKIIWLTGASSGIGEALALRLAASGAKLIISARREQALHTIKQKHPGNIHVLSLDVSDRQANIVAAQYIQEHYGYIDIALFNAGISEFVDIKNFNSNAFENTIKINYLGMVYGIEAALPLLRKSACGHIVGVASVVSYGGLPRGEAYCASKAAVKNMLEGLRVDLVPENIDVSIVCPGFVKTAMVSKNEFPMPFIISAEQAAKRICKGISRKTQEIHFPWRMSLLLKFITSLPSSITTRILYSLNKRV